MASRTLSRFLASARCQARQRRWANTLTVTNIESHRQSKLNKDREVQEEYDGPIDATREYRHVMPEFMPASAWNRRERIKDKLERIDMIRRRSAIHIPEFYVGSIMAVTVSDPYATGKVSRFVGLCIQRIGTGLRAKFILRNVIDGQGLEIMYDMYNPTMQKIEVIKLEKRLDEELLYLRDAPQEYSTVAFDMEPIPLPKGAPVPVYTKMIELNPLPWERRWEKLDFKGVIIPSINAKLEARAVKFKAMKAIPKYDLMEQYRAGPNEADETRVYREAHITQKTHPPAPPPRKHK